MEYMQMKPKNILNKANLIIMCGPPACGKSSFSKDFVNNFDNVIRVSRDDIRFSLLQEHDKYFDKENLVFQVFIDEIVDGLKIGQTVIADATHINEKSRRILLDNIFQHISMDQVNIVPFNFQKYSIDKLNLRNNQREGRARVPEEILKTMYDKYVPAHNNEKYKYTYIVNDL